MAHHSIFIITFKFMTLLRTNESQNGRGKGAYCWSFSGHLSLGPLITTFGFESGAKVTIPCSISSFDPFDDFFPLRPFFKVPDPPNSFLWQKVKVDLEMYFHEEEVISLQSSPAQQTSNVNRSAKSERHTGKERKKGWCEDQDYLHGVDKPG